MNKPQPRVGRFFGRLQVVEKVENSVNNDGDHKYRCLCECGTWTTAKWSALKKGKKKSCGCLQREHIANMKAIAERNRAERKLKTDEYKAKADGKSRHALFCTYRHMIDRCENPKAHNFKYYGARGITVCARWRDDFWKFVDDMGERPTGTTLDRIDPNGNYEPENCRWADAITQYSNVRNVKQVFVATIRGETAFITEWARRKGVNERTIRADIKKGIPPDIAVVAAVFRKKLWSMKGGNVKVSEYAKCYDAAKKWLAASTNV